MTALLLAILAAAAPGRFEVKKLAVDGDVLEVIPVDLDGDGRKDLLVTFRRGVPPAQTRFFALFWNQGTTFSSKPDQVVQADADTCAFDVADVDGVPGAELLLITPRGVLARSLKGRAWGEPVELVSQPTLFYQADHAELSRLQIVQDVASADSHDLIVPSLGALTVYRRSGSTFAPAGRLEIPIDSSAKRRGFGKRPTSGMAALVVQHHFPGVHVADSDGDGRRDVIATLEDRLAVYRQTEGGSFGEKPSYQRNFAIRTPEELRNASSTAAISVSDIDGDGIADLIVRKQVEHGLASALATTFVFFGQKNGGYAEKAEQVMKTEGASGSDVELVDLTGDGHPDLVVPSVNIGVWAIIKALTTKTLNVNFQIYPFVSARRRFADKPTAERELKFNLSLSGEADPQAVDERGDYNGDKRPDLVFGTGENELSIFPGIAGAGLFADEAIETIPVRAYGSVQATDLDAKGKSDLVLHYPSTKDHRGEIVILLNRGPW